jgi:quinol monooxygenase YgiN
MFARMVSLITFPARRSDLDRVIHEEIAPLVKGQKGFVDYLTLISDEEPRLVVVISLWENRSAAEIFDRELSSVIFDYLKALLQAEPQVRTFDCSSIHSRRSNAVKRSTA